MGQQQVFQRPPTEADSFIIRVMEGCPHNKCTFCGSFSNIPFRPVPLDEVMQGIGNDARELGSRYIPMVKSLYLEGGDPIALSTATLVRIMAHAKHFFPYLERISCYSTVAQIKKKNDEELSLLSLSGLKRVYVGIESGCDAILRDTQKGCTTEDMALAAEKLRNANIENDVSIMIGLGGKELSERNAVETSRILNKMKPLCVRVRTFVPYFHTQMGDDYLHGRFTLLNPHEALCELRKLVENIHENIFFLGEHWSNFIFFGVQLPEGKEKLLAGIDAALQKSLVAFRPTGITEFHAMATEREFYGRAQEGSPVQQ